MVVSKRERYIGIAASVVIGVLVLDSIVFRPLMDRADQIDRDLADAQKQKGENENLLRESTKRDSEWKQLAGRGVSSDQSGAESQVLNGLEQWAHDAGLSLTQVKPDRVEKTKDFSISSFRATATGGMEQIGRFLYAIETASIPVPRERREHLVEEGRHR